MARLLTIITYVHVGVTVLFVYLWATVYAREYYGVFLPLNLSSFDAFGATLIFSPFVIGFAIVRRRLKSRAKAFDHPSKSVWMCVDQADSVPSAWVFALLAVFLVIANYLELLGVVTFLPAIYGTYGVMPMTGLTIVFLHLTASARRSVSRNCMKTVTRLSDSHENTWGNR